MLPQRAFGQVLGARAMPVDASALCVSRDARAPAPQVVRTRTYLVPLKLARAMAEEDDLPVDVRAAPADPVVLGELLKGECVALPSGEEIWYAATCHEGVFLFAITGNLRLASLLRWLSLPVRR